MENKKLFFYGFYDFRISTPSLFDPKSMRLLSLKEIEDGEIFGFSVEDVEDWEKSDPIKEKAKKLQEHFEIDFCGEFDEDFQEEQIEAILFFDTEEEASNRYKKELQNIEEVEGKTIEDGLEIINDIEREVLVPKDIFIDEMIFDLEHELRNYGNMTVSYLDSFVIDFLIKHSNDKSLTKSLFDINTSDTIMNKSASYEIAVPLVNGDLSNKGNLEQVDITFDIIEESEKETDVVVRVTDAVRRRLA